MNSSLYASYKVMENNEGQAVQTIPSYEVAKMIGVQHKHLLEKIDGINEDLVAENSSTKKYWFESTFENRGKIYRCFQITKRGCEFIAHKTTGTKGNIFTHRYMERFEQMEKQLKGELVPINNLQEIISDTVTKEISRLRKEHSEYIKPLSADKYRITKYIKDRLDITKANKEFDLVKERVLMLLGAEKWEDVPVETLLNSMNLIDESIKVVKADRKENQVAWF